MISVSICQHGFLALSSFLASAAPAAVFGLPVMINRRPVDVANGPNHDTSSGQGLQLHNKEIHVDNEYIHMLVRVNIPTKAMMDELKMYVLLNMKDLE